MQPDSARNRPDPNLNRQQCSAQHLYQNIRLMWQTKNVYVKQLCTKLHKCKKVSNYLTKQQVSNKQYIDMTVRALPRFTIAQQIYEECFPFALVGADKHTSMRCNKLLSLETGPFSIMDVQSHVMDIEKKGISNTIYVSWAKLVQTKDDVTTRIAPSLNPSAETKVAHDTDLNSREPPEYVETKFVNHRRTLNDWEYRVHRYGYVPQEDSWELASHIPGHSISSYRKFPKRTKPVHVQPHLVKNKCKYEERDALLISTTTFGYIRRRLSKRSYLSCIHCSKRCHILIHSRTNTPSPSAARSDSEAANLRRNSEDGY